jgi:hypothetical protein
MKCSNPNCNRGIGLIAHQRGCFSKRRYCSSDCRDALAVGLPKRSSQEQSASTYFEWLFLQPIVTAPLPMLLTFVALAGPHGTTMYVAPSQIVAIIDSPDVGACPTTLITMSQTVYVCESPAEVKRKLEAVTVPVLVNDEKNAPSSF